uniref:Fe2OG dioxygenase domain-containing protein n=1 Tax=Tetranychus urticae TaxID=32264 RepID=T1KQ53_TETUR
MAEYNDKIKEFWSQGYTVLPDFLSPSEVDNVLKETKQIVDTLDLDEHRNVFKIGKSKQGDDYFLDSSDKISFFFEQKAIDSDGNLTCPHSQCLNKIGHALHALNPVFKAITFDDRIKSILKTLGCVEPHVIQSMVIFKHPHIGDEVSPHKDAEFLYTDPVDKLTGFWLALEDVTIENGCLWFIPGSHKEPVTQRFVRNKDDSGPRASFNVPKAKYDDSKFVPLKVSKGSLVLLHGLVVHKSGSNTSLSPRPVYTFHVVDFHKTQWSPDNWLQPTEKLPFCRVY